MRLSTNLLLVFSPRTERGDADTLARAGHPWHAAYTSRPEFTVYGFVHLIYEYISVARLCADKQ